ARRLEAAVACLREGAVAEADAPDAGMVYGTGCAPFLGGPMRYAEARGVAAVVQRLRELAAECGERFAPDPGWERAGDWLERVPVAAAGADSEGSRTRA